jgi:hypothetical protein
LNKSRKKAEGRGKKEEGRGKREEGSIAFALKMRPFFIPNSEFTL